MAPVSMVLAEEAPRTLYISDLAKNGLTARRRSSKHTPRGTPGDRRQAPAFLARSLGVQPEPVRQHTAGAEIATAELATTAGRAPSETVMHSSHPAEAVVLAAAQASEMSRLLAKPVTAGPAGEEDEDTATGIDEEASQASTVDIVEFCDDRVVRGLAAALEQMVAMAEETPIRTSFHSVRAPGVTITAYLQRLAKFFCCSAECFVLALVYIDRVIQKCPQVAVCSLTCHRLSACSLTLAAKWHDDVFYSNAYYAKVCGLSTKELSGLEEKLLVLLGHRLVVQPEEFEMYRAMLHKVAGPRGAEQ